MQTIDINCKGVLNGIAAVLPKMLARKSGHIVNISSDAGRKVFAGLGVYSASKMFVEAVSQVRAERSLLVDALARARADSLTNCVAIVCG